MDPLRPRYILHRPKVVSPFDVLTDRQKKELTYMTLPPDALKHIRPKNPQALSDKNRVAQSPHPTLDKKTLEQLQAMRREVRLRSLRHSSSSRHPIPNRPRRNNNSRSRRLRSPCNPSRMG